MAGRVSSVIDKIEEPPSAQGITLDSATRSELAQLLSQLTGGACWPTFTHGDPCPDNNSSIDGGDGARTPYLPRGARDWLPAAADDATLAAAMADASARHRLPLFVDVAGRTDALPGLAEVAESLHRRLSGRWMHLEPIPMYPSLR